MKTENDLGRQDENREPDFETYYATLIPAKNGAEFLSVEWALDLIQQQCHNGGDTISIKQITQDAIYYSYKIFDKTATVNPIVYDNCKLDLANSKP